jgi:hypothetical protein
LADNDVTEILPVNDERLLAIEHAAVQNEHRKYRSDSLVAVSDNNFNGAQVTQFLVSEVKPR